MANKTQYECSCPCGETTFTVNAKPVMRSYCHCTICQDFNDADFADICVLPARKISDLDDSKISYKAYANPPVVQRGKCNACGQPAIEFIESPLGRMTAIIPSANFNDESALPEPSFHGFYHRRKADAQDDLPKYEGYLASQAGLAKHFAIAVGRRVAGKS